MTNGAEALSLVELTDDITGSETSDAMLLVVELALTVGCNAKTNEAPKTAAIMIEIKARTFILFSIFWFFTSQVSKKV